MSDVHIEYLNEVEIKVIAERSILFELSDHFAFYAEGYKFDKRFKNRMWDGKVRLFSSYTGITYAGLAQKIKKFCDNRKYSITWDEELYYDETTDDEIEDFIESILPENFEVRDYQIETITKSIQSRRRLILSPTSSGKSLIIYGLIRWYENRLKNSKALIIVPSIGLVNQMASDFEEYGYTGTIHKSTEGLSKSDNIEADIILTTWQSLNNGKTKMHKSWYDQFDVVFGDEAHQAKAKSLIEIMKNLHQCRYRFGLTGTLDGSKLSEMTIIGLFGPIYSSITTREMIDQGYAPNIKIKCIVLKYPESVKKDFFRSKKNDKGQYVRKSYAEEIDYITKNEKRNKYLKKLTLSLKGNKLLFFHITDHGNLLRDSIKEDHPNTFYIDRTVKGKQREEIRKSMEQYDDAVLVASRGTTSTGISIKKLHRMILGHPQKARIKLLQSIGRLLRQHLTKSVTYIYDIVDDISYKKNKNYTLEHFLERVKIYDEQQFDYEIFTVNL